jgi:hypothetical protein
MNKRAAADLRSEGCRGDNNNTSLGRDLIWGVTSIAAEIGRTERQAFYLLEHGKIPAKKVGGRWCALRSGLRQFFEGHASGSVA